MADSYIIRIYRRKQDAEIEMYGTVAGVNSESNRLFSSAEELWQILRGGADSVDEQRFFKGGNHQNSEQ